MKKKEKKVYKTVYISYYHGRKYLNCEYEHLEEFENLDIDYINFILSDIIRCGYNVQFVQNCEDATAIIYIDRGNFRQR